MKTVNELIKDWQENGNLQSRNKAVEQSMKLVYNVCRKFSYYKSLKDDLEQEGMIALIKACDTFKTTEVFSTYAYLVIRNTLSRHVIKYKSITTGGIVTSKINSKIYSNLKHCKDINSYSHVKQFAEEYKFNLKNVLQVINSLSYESVEDYNTYSDNKEDVSSIVELERKLESLMSSIEANDVNGYIALRYFEGDQIKKPSEMGDNNLPKHHVDKLMKKLKESMLEHM